eukprot:TRINITY_DN82300_c0_g1_i1.p1 TRINITY_DN82300_c0_g1~~TRINITY_DN82300_c0_g1_i1.p1  ORF type:complete len:396 (+),score=41.39 TRINITY_DN82300_c0_g1_i1:49-1236(+)
MDTRVRCNSGDGSIDRVGIFMPGSHQCPVCCQRFDSEKTLDTHYSFFHDQHRPVEVAEEMKSTSGGEEEQYRDSCTDAMECAICMDSIEEETILPCRCKLHYCQVCWDKALANSFSQCGQARCPSCRSSVRVDFDAKTHRMLFTAETEDTSGASQSEMLQEIRREYMQSVGRENQMQVTEESFRVFLEAHVHYERLEHLHTRRRDMVDRLRHQAMPAQIMLFQQYAAENPSLLAIKEDASETLRGVSIADLKGLMATANVDAHDCLEKSEMIARLVDRTDADALCALWAWRTSPAPKCVCHHSLQRVNGLERFKHSLGERGISLSRTELQHRLSQRRGASIVICDICEENVPLSEDSFVWTCENRNGTILHATSYDICDRCFVHHSCGSALKQEL